jgi:hypothetical protein
MPNKTTKFFAVDRVESGVAIMMDDDLNELAVSVSQFRGPVIEGTVMKVPISDKGPDWGAGMPDEKEKNRRLSVAQAKLRQMQRKDPGGDLDL